jgi:hypothetical protein
MDYISNNYVRSSGSGINWTVQIDGPVRPVKSYYEETVNVAEIVWSQKQGNLFLCYSGGLDSEYVLAVFKSLGMPITPVIMRTQYNHHETQYAFKYCDENSITPVVIDLDYDKFVESGEFLKIATEYKIAAYQLPSNLWLTTQIDGTVITGDSNPHLFLHNDNKWYVDEIEPVYSQFEFFKRNNIHGTPFFLSYTSEQYFAFLTDPTMVALARNHIPGKTGSYSSKVHVYNNQNRFKLEQRVKKHGYELVEQSPIFNHPDIQLVNSWKDKWWGSSNHEYFQLIERLSWTK